MIPTVHIKLSPWGDALQLFYDRSTMTYDIVEFNHMTLRDVESYLLAHLNVRYEWKRWNP